MVVEIIDMDHLGRGIGKIDGKVIFVPKTVTGDIVRVKIVKDNKKYYIGKLDEIIKKSLLRCKEKCPYYTECGGCNIMNLEYSEQVKFKVNKVKNIFKKYLDMDIKPNIISSRKIYEYRNKITYHVDKEIGLIDEDNNIIKVDKCLLVSDKVNELYKLISLNDLSMVKKVVIKECDNGLILDIDGKMDISNIKDKCIEIYMNNECIYHKIDGYMVLNNLKFKVSNRAFFQINSSNITRLYDEVIRLANISKDDTVIDLYSGVGSIGLYISKYAKKVYGIEIIPEAIEDAKINIKLNNIKNAEYICGDVAKLIDKTIMGDIIITDPPRIGMDKHTVKVINESNIDKVIYVSCDPMTLVRDLKLLDKYELVDISVVDMFPMTHHCESIVLLKLK